MCISLCEGVFDAYQLLTHSCRENNNPQHIHAFAGARWCFHDDVRRRREIQREVLHISAVVVLDAVDVDPARGCLVQELCHCRFGDEFWHSLGSILANHNRAKARTWAQSTWHQHRCSKHSDVHSEVLTIRGKDLHYRWEQAINTVHRVLESAAVLMAFSDKTEALQGTGLLNVHGKQRIAWWYQYHSHVCKLKMKLQLKDEFSAHCFNFFAKIIHVLLLVATYLASRREGGTSIRKDTHTAPRHWTSAPTCWKVAWTRLAGNMFLGKRIKNKKKSFSGWCGCVVKHIQEHAQSKKTIT